MVATLRLAPRFQKKKMKMSSERVRTLLCDFKVAARWSCVGGVLRPSLTVGWAKGTVASAHVP